MNIFHGIFSYSYTVYKAADVEQFESNQAVEINSILNVIDYLLFFPHETKTKNQTPKES